MHIEQYLTITVFYHDYCNEQYNGVRTRPPPEISPGAWSQGTEPSALEVWCGEMGRPEQRGQSCCRLSKHGGPQGARRTEHQLRHSAGRRPAPGFGREPGGGSREACRTGQQHRHCLGRRPAPGARLRLGPGGCSREGRRTKHQPRHSAEPPSCARLRPCAGRRLVEGLKDANSTAPFPLPPHSSPPSHPIPPPLPPPFPPEYHCSAIPIQDSKFEAISPSPTRRDCSNYPRAISIAICPKLMLHIYAYRNPFCSLWKSKD